MYIRPYSISQTAILLLSLLLIFYLRASTQQHPKAEHTATRWMMRAIALAALAILLNLLATIAELPLFNAIVYLRICLLFLFWHAIARALFALPPRIDVVQQAEARWTNRVLYTLATLEFCYFCYRFWIFWQSGTVPARPKVLELPLLMVSLWVVVLTARKLWMAETLLPSSAGKRRRQLLLYPTSDDGRFYRWFLFVVVSLLGVNLILANLLNRPQPIGIAMFSDLLSSGAIVCAQFAYLNYRLAPVGLELRVVGAGLTIFLGLVSVLGWIITLAFLNQAAPGVAPSMIFGGPVQLDFVLQLAYRPLAASLSELLLPVLCFEIAGSLLFVYAYTFYYRRTLKIHFQRILTGFAAVEQGNLTYRIADIVWQDEFSQIATSFNLMAESLDESNHELQSYQRHLQDLVEQRTAELMHEIELRKNMEVRQGIQEERARIARETHDGLLQTLMAVRIRLNRGKQLSRLEADAIQRELNELSGEIMQSIQDLRNLINELNTNILQHGLIGTLEQSIERQKRTYPITVDCDFVYTPGVLTVGQELNLMRIVQEAMSNAIRHGEASKLWVSIHTIEHGGNPTQIDVQVCDNGRGFDPNHVPEHAPDRGHDHGNGTGWGLQNMRRRAEELHATLQIQRQPHNLTTVDLTIPLQEQPSAG